LRRMDIHLSLKPTLLTRLRLPAARTAPTPIDRLPGPAI